MYACMYVYLFTQAWLHRTRHVSVRVRGRYVRVCMRVYCGFVCVWYRALEEEVCVEQLVRLGQGLGIRVCIPQARLLLRRRRGLLT